MTGQDQPEQDGCVGTMPQQLFRIVWRDGAPVSVRAELVRKEGSWWYVRHPDGSITTHNGGGFAKSDTAWFLGRWNTTISDAWLNEANRLFVLAGIASEIDHRSTYREQHWQVVQAAMEDAYELGKLIGSCEAGKGATDA